MSITNLEVIKSLLIMAEKRMIDTNSEEENELYYLIDEATKKAFEIIYERKEKEADQH